MKKGMIISKELSRELKGFFSLVVVFAHCRNNMPLLNNTVLGMALTASGYLAVAVFFFLSGYGVEIQYKKHGKKYLEAFPKSRILSLYIISSIAVLFYAVVDSVLYDGITLTEFIFSFLYGRTIMLYGWYLQAALLLYLLYFVSRRFFAKNRQGVAIAIGIIVYGCLSWSLCSSPLLYCSSALAFPVGVFFAAHAENWSLTKSKRIWLCVLSAALFGVTFWIGNRYLGHKVFWGLCRIFSAAFFVIIIFLLHLKEKSPFCGWLGEISLETYLIQEFPMRLFRSEYIHINNDWVYLLIVVTATITLARLIHPLVTIIVKLVKNISPHRQTKKQES